MSKEREGLAFVINTSPDMTKLMLRETAFYLWVNNGVSKQDAENLAGEIKDPGKIIRAVQLRNEVARPAEWDRENPKGNLTNIYISKL